MRRSILMTSLLALSACAPAVMERSTEERLSTRITLNMTAPVHEVVQAAADRAEVEVEFGDGVNDPISVTVKDVPFREVVDGICRTMNLTWRQADENCLRVERRRT